MRLLEFDTVTLVAGVVALLLVAGATRVLTDRFKFPYTVALVLIGVAIGEAARAVYPDVSRFTEMPMAADIILFVLIPTLIFEAAFHTNGRLLRQNLWPVLTLAVPGALLGSLLIGVIVWAVSPLGFAESWLLGAILSSTDPIAVVGIFRKIGAPARLTMLVEGESLLNDATTIVLSRILLGVIAVGTFGAGNVQDGIIEFVLVFFGGALIGWIVAMAIGWLISKVHDDPFTTTALTAILAYASFLIPEKGFHLSGVMGSVAAGLVMADWGRTKMSPHDEEHIESFWHFAGNAANAMLFLLVGFSVEVSSLLANIDLFAWVVLALLVSRALVVYGVAPLLPFLPNTRPISFAYQTVLWWGGLRGGIAIAIVLGLTSYEFGDTFVALVMGSVLFNLIVQGMSMERLVRWFGLDRPSVADRVARSESELDALRAASARIPELREGGLFSARIAEDLDGKLNTEIGRVKTELDELRRTELDSDQERRLLLSRCFAAEQAYYHGLFRKGHLSERTYRHLVADVVMQTDAVRDGVPLPSRGAARRARRSGVVQWLSRIAPSAANRFGRGNIAGDYEGAWGSFQAASHLLEDIDKLAQAHSTPEQIVGEVRAMYVIQQISAREQLDATAAQFPEFVTVMQERLAQRLLTLAQTETIQEKAAAGAVPPGIADDILRALTVEQRELRGGVTEGIAVNPKELLRKVPFFKDMPEQEFAKIADVLVERSFPAGDTIVAQGARGASLYLIARGVVRVSAAGHDGVEHDLASLVAGDFFGEMAVLTAEPRSATCRAVTPCALYELRRTDFQHVTASMPAVRAAVERANQERRRAVGEPQVRPVA